MAWGALAGRLSQIDRSDKTPAKDGQSHTSTSRDKNESAPIIKRNRPAGADSCGAVRLLAARQGSYAAVIELARMVIRSSAHALWRQNHAGTETQTRKPILGNVADCRPSRSHNCFHRGCCLLFGIDSDRRKADAVRLEQCRKSMPRTRSGVDTAFPSDIASNRKDGRAIRFN